jgi:hypothetical protein
MQPGKGPAAPESWSAQEVERDLRRSLKTIIYR